LAIYHEDHCPNAAVTSIKGLKPGNPAWRNQDNFFVIDNYDGRDFHMYCVFDGHGEHGHHVSRRCREVFPQHLKAANFELKRAFLNMQNDLCACEYDVRCSGATCVLALLQGKVLTVANCGDSRAVIARRNGNGAVSGHPLTTDHKPDNPDERKRIVAMGGQVGCRHVLVQQGRGNPVSMPVGPCRVWYQNRVGETLGLAMSRSLGDAVAHKCGVSAEPEVFEHTTDPSDEFMVLATDGVFDVLDNQQVVQIAFNAMTASMQGNGGKDNRKAGGGGAAAGVPASNWPLEAANNICRFARSKWERLSPMVDDITCIVVPLRR
jgi:serine/threonine protein phosphatase PrpC